MVDAKANNQLRILIHSLESSRGLRKVLSQANTRLANKFLRVVSVAAGDAAYMMNLKILELTKRRRRSIKPNKRRRAGSRGGSGVYFLKDRGKWGARITVRGKRVFLGSFDTELKAKRAVAKARRNRNG